MGLAEEHGTLVHWERSRGICSSADIPANLRGYLAGFLARLCRLELGLERRFVHWLLVQ